MADNPAVGQLLHDLTWKSIREMNAARRYGEMVELPRKKNIKNTCEYNCPPELITRKQAAELLGVPITAVKFWAWTGKLSSTVVKGKRYYDPEKIMAEYSRIDRKRGPRT